MLKNGIIFLDWDGTLSHGRFWSELNAEIYEKIQRSLFEGNKALIDAWMVGDATSEDVCDWLVQSTGLTSDVLLNALQVSCQRMTLAENIVDRILQIKKDHHVVLVTDNMDCFSRFTVPAQRMADIFDMIVNSSDVKRLKRDDGGLSFKEIAQKYGVAFNVCTLIDDSEKTCALFRKLGGAAHKTVGVQYTNELLSLALKKQ